MVRLDLDQVVMRRMKEEDIEVVKALIKVCTAHSDKLLVREFRYTLRLVSQHTFLCRRAARARKIVSSSTS